ncbi:hypothetical protein LOTGIDRAFT_167540 [Lottia gigantea]|uniref:Kringle domain-containing protein n=1 Tax=Lottia gigantea TaxID=225164 RepID=V3ZTY5_LOTGI|nr:hypothetical protein LOTGIDRAFT_167540 [Lottia gigantea]ESO86035.1 hypothetical protein LOTGIDRAFT_167540 [Lottia gigantea]
MNVTVMSFIKYEDILKEMKSLARIIIIVIFMNIALCTGCTEPQPVPHAYRYTDNISLPEGSWVNYTCYHNYYWIGGDLNRECQAGVLTGKPPVCDEYKILSLARSAIPKPGSLGGNGNSLTDGDERTCESTTASTEPSWTIEFNGTRYVYSVYVTLDMVSNIGIDRIEVYVRNTTSQHPGILCGTKNSPLSLTDIVELVCPPNSIGSQLVIQGSGTGLGGLGLCEVKAVGKDWLYECGDPPFVYGAEVTSDYISQGLVVVQYSCVKGFYYGGKNPESTCRSGQWSKVDLLCLPYDSLYNPKLKQFVPDHWVLFDDDQNTCIEADGGVITHPTIQYRVLAYNLYSVKPVELLSLTVTIGLNETWDDIDFVGVPVPLPDYKEYDAPPCEYDGLSTDLYRVRTFSCQPYTYSKILNVIIRDVSSNFKEFCKIKSTIRFNTVPLECIRGEYINEYKGKMNYTWDGKVCDNWADAPPDKAINTTVHKTFDPDSELNYCRNIGGEKRRPWCWVDNYQSVGYCPLTFCNEICHLKEEYTEYQGQQSISTSGKNCRYWSDGNEEGRTFLNEVFSGVQTRSYCRNPGYSQFKAWCYVNGPESTIVAEPCDVPECPIGFPRLTVRNNETSNFPLHLDQCYQPLNSFNVHHYFDLTIDETSVNNFCRNFQDNSLFCFNGVDWTMIEFECFDVPPETTTIAETSSYGPETTFLMEETSTNFVEEIETFSQFEISSTIVESSSVEASQSISASSSQLFEASSSLQISSLLQTTSSLDDSSVPTSTLVEANSSFVSESLANATEETTRSLLPSFILSTMDTASVTSDLPETASIDASSNTHDTLYTDQTVTPTVSSSLWSASITNNTGRNMTCGYFCIRDDLLNTSDPFVRARIEFLTKSLEMDYEKLSASIRKRISAEDDRPSATYVGSSALTMMVIFLALIVFPDVIDLFRFLHDRILLRKMKVVKIDDTEKITSQ